MMYKLPPDHLVDAAIAAACALTGAVPFDVVNGLTEHKAPYTTSRARAYAALALRAICETYSRQAIALACGSKSVDSYILGLDFRMRNGTIKWWRDDQFMQVVKAIEQAEKEHAQSVEVVPGLLPIGFESGV